MPPVHLILRERQFEQARLTRFRRLTLCLRGGSLRACGSLGMGILEGPAAAE